MNPSQWKWRYSKLAGILVAGLVLVSAAIAAWDYQQRARPPQIDFSESRHDFGNVAEGIKVSHVFRILNKGGQALLIKEAKSTCDCTTANLKLNSVPGGGSVNLEVIMDTTMKQGRINKELLVISNDPAHPQSKIFVAANVDPHAGMSSGSRGKIFVGKCATCHVQQGIGKTGEDLYIADCAMCHGFRADGGEAPSLVRFNYDHKLVAAYIREVIAHGSKSHLSMPGFLKQVGGPLTNDQIDSLVAYLHWRTNMNR